jgi:hypothetical protein
MERRFIPQTKNSANGRGLLLIETNSILKISLYSWVHFKIFPVSFGGYGLFFA